MAFKNIALIVGAILAGALSLPARDGIKTLGDTRWTHATTSNDWSVSCYWVAQFSDAGGASNVHCVVVLPSSKYSVSEARIEAHIEKMLDGLETIDRNTIRRWNQAMSDADIKMILTDNPRSALGRLGLVPRETKLPEEM